MRLIDADALISAIENSRGKNSIYAQFVRAWVKEAPTIDAVPVEVIMEIFGDNPCDYSFCGVSIDDFMFSECGDWCESNCENVPALECWKQFFKVWEERKSQWIKQN